MKFPSPLPSTLGLAALVLFLGWQTVLNVQIRTQLHRSLKGREALVGQSQLIQGSASQFLSDLIDLSEQNTNAKAIVQKYGISRNASSPSR